jgi:hypothetical protein
VELSTDDVADALRGVGYDPNDVVAAGAGAWSSCFAFRAEGRDLVVRFGPYLEDFEKDRFAARFSCAAMPVPHVEMADAVGDGFLVVSARALGVPLEEVSRPEWERLVPAIVELLEALRTAEIPAGGLGGMVPVSRRTRVGRTTCSRSAGAPAIAVQPTGMTVSVSDRWCGPRSTPDTRVSPDWISPLPRVR